jgi:hypothetical protein
MGKATMLRMAKRKKIDKPDEDRHASTFMVRLPEVYRDQLRKLRETTRRPMTTEIQIALEEHLAKSGLWPPEETGMV